MGQFKEISVDIREFVDELIDYKRSRVVLCEIITALGLQGLLM